MCDNFATASNYYKVCKSHPYLNCVKFWQKFFEQCLQEFATVNICPLMITVTGLTVIQKRVRSGPALYFQKTFAEYQAGFASGGRTCLYMWHTITHCSRWELAGPRRHGQDHCHRSLGTSCGPHYLGGAPVCGLLRHLQGGWSHWMLVHHFYISEIFSLAPPTPGRPRYELHTDRGKLWLCEIYTGRLHGVPQWSKVFSKVSCYIILV